MKKIAVLCGGTSDERDLSLRGGGCIAKALRSLGYDDAEVVDLTLAYDPFELRRYDVVFVCLHGPFGEDGSVQGLLEILRVPYTFSGCHVHSVCVSKIRTKRYLASLRGVRLIPDDIISKGDVRTGVAFPVMVKDPQSGSSRGVWRCETDSELEAAVARCVSTEGILVEQFITGVDVVCCVLDGKCLPVMEFKTDLEWQDLASKNALWDWDGKNAPSKTIEKVCPAKALPEAVVADVQKTAKRVYDFLGCRGALNVEFRVAGADVYFVEVSSIPAMTDTSVHAECAKAAGISFPEVAETILLAAKCDVAC